MGDHRAVLRPGPWFVLRQLQRQVAWFLRLRMQLAEIALHYHKDLQRIIIALDEADPEGFNRNAAFNSFGDNRIQKYLPIVGRAAKPRGQIDSVPDCGVVDSTLVADGPDNRWPHRNSHAEADRVTFGAPADNKRLNCGLHVDGEANCAKRRIRLSDRRIHKKHNAVSTEAGQCSFVARGDGSKGFVVFPKNPHQGVGRGAGRESRETAQIAEIVTTSRLCNFSISSSDFSTISATCGARNRFKRAM